MSNYLQVSMKESILTLKNMGWSKRAISRQLGVHRNTVNRYLSLNRSKCTTVTTGAGIDNQAVIKSKCTTVTTGDSDGKSLCEPFRGIIEKYLDRKLSAKRIHQDLCYEYSFTGSYESVKRYVRVLSECNELPFRRMETLPGVEVQVDYGSGSRIVDSSTGKWRKSHVFRIVLSHSRKAYAESSFTQCTESFIRAMENSFRYFGGVPETVVIDNLKAGVLKPCVYEPELNPKLQEFAKHYGTCILPSKVATPRHKGKVESSVKYVQDNALKGRTFHSIPKQNEYLRYWESNIADQRIHGTTKKQVGSMFQKEKQYLHPLPKSLYPVFEEEKRKVHRDGHVEVKKAFYSVPPEYVKREVWVRYTIRTVRVFNHRMEEIAFHSRKEPGCFSTMNAHIPYQKISNPEKGNEWLIRQADKIGFSSGAWARVMLKNRGIPGTRVLNGLLQLDHKYTSSAIDDACRKALEYECFYLRELKRIINDSGQKEQQQFSFIEEHPLIRKINEYDNINSIGLFNGTQIT